MEGVILNRVTIFFDILPCTKTNGSSPAAIYANCVDLAFSLIKFYYCLSKANKVAHELARSYFFSRDSCNSDDDPLVFF
jgi:hypothetical protein